MKKALLLILIIPMISNAFAQDYRQNTDINHTVNPNVRYKLYPTANMWTYLKLDTQTGKITQVQYSNTSNEFEVLLGSPDYITPDDKATNGRFELYPTSNMWTFILIDQIYGDTYHVQWSQERKERGIIRIKYEAFQ